MNSPPRLTAVGSGKGGTGKTLLATGLAHALALQGERVLLCDADFGLSNTSIHLGLPSGGNLPGFLAHDSALRDAVVPVSGGTRMCGGFDLLAAPPGSGTLADSGEDTAASLVALLRADRGYDRVLFDLGAGVGAATMHLAAAAHETIVVATPDPASLTDAYAFVKILMRVFAAPPSVVVNMAASDAEARRTAASLSTTCDSFLETALKYLGGIPRDPRVLEALRRQELLARIFPEAAASCAIASIAARLHVPLVRRPALVNAR
jgi:flagellar biosynthesis protein FlhG